VAVRLLEEVLLVMVRGEDGPILKQGRSSAGERAWQGAAVDVSTRVASEPDLPFLCDADTTGQGISTSPGAAWEKSQLVAAHDLVLTSTMSDER
jgi:hypothetical protein